MKYQLRTTGLQWPQVIPEGWPLVRISSAFVERNETVSDKDFAPLSVTMKGIVPQLETAAKTDNGDNRKKVCVGDFVINSRSDRKGSAGVSPYDGSVSIISTILKPRASVVGSYINYLLTCYHFQEEFYRHGKGIVDDLWSTKYSNMKGMYIPLPPIEEQHAIAQYLDTQSARIARFIAKKQTLITLLKEQKAAVIQQALTPSFWKEEIPESDWVKKKLKFVARVQTGRTPSIENAKTDFFADGTINWFTPGDFNDDGELKISNRRLHKSAVESNEVEIFPAGSVYLIGIGGTLGKVGFCVNEASANQQINVLVFNKEVIPVFGFYYLQSLREYLYKSADYTTLPILNQSKTKAILLNIPSKKTQGKVVGYIRAKHQKIDAIITRTEREITFVKELQQSIIAEAVTGKINVSQ